MWTKGKQSCDIATTTFAAGSGTGDGNSSAWQIGVQPTRSVEPEGEGAIFIIENMFEVRYFVVRTLMSSVYYFICLLCHFFAIEIGSGELQVGVIVKPETVL